MLIIAAKGRLFLFVH